MRNEAGGASGQLQESCQPSRMAPVSRSLGELVGIELGLAEVDEIEIDVGDVRAAQVGAAQVGLANFFRVFEVHFLAIVGVKASLASLTCDGAADEAASRRAHVERRAVEGRTREVRSGPVDLRQMREQKLASRMSALGMREPVRCACSRLARRQRATNNKIFQLRVRQIRGIETAPSRVAVRKSACAQLCVVEPGIGEVDVVETRSGECGAAEVSSRKVRFGEVGGCQVGFH